jgi:hypothetical protein
MPVAIRTRRARSAVSSYRVRKELQKTGNGSGPGRLLIRHGAGGEKSQSLGDFTQSEARVS